LKDVLIRNGTTAIWEKAVFYHFIHAVMLFVLATRQPLARIPWFSFLIGIVLFSGSLYVLAITNVRWLGAITPFGGGNPHNAAVLYRSDSGRAEFSWWDRLLVFDRK
jgi:uncharacterized membrane protein YgdD (TMEM256/DUF423 family)